MSIESRKVSRPEPAPIAAPLLCTGNSARSQIAGALLARKDGERFRVASTQTTP